MRSASSTCSMPAPRAAPDPPLRAALATADGWRPGDVPAQPRDGRPAADWVWRRPIREPRSLVVLCDISGSMERHSRLLLRFVQALSARQRGPDRVVRVRDAADPGHAAAARPRSRPGARPRVRRGQRLGRRHADRRVLPDVQPALGAPDAADARRRHRRVATAGTAATRRSWRPRRRACGATATGWSGSTRWPARPATSRWPAGCGRPSRTSTTSCRPGPSPVLERLGEILGGRPLGRHPPGRRGGRPRRAARPLDRPRLLPRGRPAIGRRGPPDPDADREGRSDEGTARHAGRPGRRRAPTSVGRWSSGRSGPRRGPRARCCCTRPTAGSPAR